MTGFVIGIRQRQLAVAADSASYTVDGLIPAGRVTKVLVTHQHAVLFGRGVLEIGAKAGVELMTDSTLAVLEDAAEALPAILRRMTAEYAEAEGIDDPSELQIFEAVFAGWDEAAGCMRLWQMSNYVDDYAPAESQPDQQGLVTMPTAAMGHLAPGAVRLPLDARMRAGMRALRAYFAANADLTGGTVPLGGPIWLTVIEPDAITCRMIGNMPIAEADRTGNSAEPVGGLVPVSKLRHATAHPPPRRAVATRHRGLFAAGAGFAAGSVLNALLGGNLLYGSVGSGIGGLAGAGIGSLFGPVGTLLGGIGGGPVGGIRSDIFGKENEASDRIRN